MTVLLRTEEIPLVWPVVIDVRGPEGFEFLADRVAIGEVAMELGFDIAAMPSLADGVLLDLVLEEHEAGEE